MKRSQTAVGVADYYKEGRTKGVAASSTVGLRIVATSAHGKLNRLCKFKGTCITCLLQYGSRSAKIDRNKAQLESYVNMVHTVFFLRLWQGKHDVGTR